MREFIKNSASSAASVVATVLLAACGGGGGGTTSTDANSGSNNNSNNGTTGTPSVSSWPSTGYYRVVLHPSGSVQNTAGINYALSLTHPSQPGREFVIDDTPLPVRALGANLQQGTYDPVQNVFNNLQSVAYVDSTASTLRTVLLGATGARPTILSGPSTSLCSDGLMSAYNFAQPFASQLLAATPGADGQCKTSDDGQAVVSFSDTGTPSVRAETNGKRLGFFRSRTDGQPTQWVQATSKGGINLVSFATGAVTVAVPEPTTAVAAQNFVSLVGSGDLVVFTQNGILKSINPAGVVQTHSTVAANGTLSWQAIGADATYALIYRNTGAAGLAATSWQVQAIGRADQKTYPLVTGSGYVATASSNPSAVYASVINTSSAVVVKIDKTASWAKSNLFAARSDAVDVIAPLGAKAIMVITQGLQANSLPSIDVRDVSTGMVLDSYGISLPFGQESKQFDPVTAYFVPSAWFFASIGGGSRYLGGSTVKRFDVSLSQGSGGKAYVTLPDGSSLGGGVSDMVFSGGLMSEEGFAGLSAVRVSNTGSFQSASRGTYTVNTRAAGSSTLIRTTEQVR